MINTRVHLQIFFERKFKKIQENPRKIVTDKIQEVLKNS
jgi:hypothetical protein